MGIIGTFGRAEKIEVYRIYDNTNDAFIGSSMDKKGHFAERLVAARIEANVTLCFRLLAGKAKIAPKKKLPHFFPFH